MEKVWGFSSFKPSKKRLKNVLKRKLTLLAKVIIMNRALNSEFLNFFTNPTHLFIKN